MGADLMEQLLAMSLLLHVDEVDDDDPADVPEAELPGHLTGGLHVGLENGLVRILPTRVAARVHVDGDQGFRLLDD